MNIGLRSIELSYCILTPGGSDPEPSLESGKLSIKFYARLIIPNYSSPRIIPASSPAPVCMFKSLTPVKSVAGAGPSDLTVTRKSVSPEATPHC